MSCDHGLAGRKAFVTGASRGLGRAICIALAKEGADIAANYHNSDEKAQALCAELEGMGRDVLLLKGDVADYTAVQRMAETIRQRWNTLDILVNCAGKMLKSPVDEMLPVNWEDIISTNLSSAFYAIKESLPLLKESAAGRIVNISSQAAYTGSADRCAYGASKAGLLGLTYSLAKEFGPYGITVNAICPGRIETDMIADERKTREEEWIHTTPLKRFGKPEEIASAVCFLAGDSAAYITGANINVNGGCLMG